MQFKLVALLTLAVASVNAAAVHKRFGGVYTPSTSPRGSNSRFSGTCNCGGNNYGSTNIAAAASQSKTGPHGLYVAYLDAFSSFSSPLLQQLLPSYVQEP